MGCLLDIVTGITRIGGQVSRRPLQTPRRRRCTAAIALASCSVIAAACASSGSTAGPSASPNAPIKVGYLLPLTGIFTKNGTSEQNGFKLGLKHFGTSVDGHPIQVTYANDQGDPSVSLSMARQLVTSDHVQVMEGPLISSAIAVVAPYVLGKGIPEDDLYLASPLQAAAYNRFKAGFTSGWDGFAPSTVGAKWAYNTMKWRHVTTVGLDISFGWQGVGGFSTLQMYSFSTGDQVARFSDTGPRGAVIFTARIAFESAFSLVTLPCRDFSADIRISALV